MVAIAAGMDSGIAAFAYSALFFTIAGLVALKPEKLSNRLGKISSPLLILLIIILFAGTLLNPDAGSGNGTGVYSAAPLSRGFTEGYQTMDAVAGLVFGSIIAMNVRKAGEKEANVNKECIIAAFAGGLLLLAVYCALAVTGALSQAFISNASNGAAILAAAADAISPSIIPHCGNLHPRLLQHLHGTPVFMRSVLLNACPHPVKRKMDSRLFHHLPCDSNGRTGCDCENFLPCS